MVNSRVNISDIVENQLPSFVVDEFPLVSEFLSEYYRSLEFPGGSFDLLNNIDKYVKLDVVTSAIDSTVLIRDVDVISNTIFVESTAGFPDRYGIIQIDDEIITYKSKTFNSFNECYRGFSGITKIDSKNDNLSFDFTEASEHFSGSTVSNLSSLFLKQILYRIKKQIAPGFEGIGFYKDVNERLFLKQVRNFYSSKGSSKSFKILFNVLYGEKVEVLRPSDNLILPSTAKYNKYNRLVVESKDRSILKLKGRTVYQTIPGSNNRPFATVLKVDEIIRNGKIYYSIAFDNDYLRDITLTSGTISGKFSVSPKTKVVSTASSKSDFLTVDSTLGFPDEGELVITLENGINRILNYYSKNSNQFLECEGINIEIPSGSKVEDTNYGYGYDIDGNKIEFKITSVLTDPDILSLGNYFSEGDPILVNNIGLQSDLPIYTSWMYNNAIFYKVKSISLVDLSNFSYSIDLFDDSYLYIGDKLSIYDEYNNKSYLIVSSLNNKKSVVVESQNGTIDITKKYYIERNVSYVNSTDNFINKNTSNVTNVYCDYLNTVVDVTSNSFPSYSNLKINLNKNKVIFNGTFDGEEIQIGTHPFLTGDPVYYIPKDKNNSLNINFGLYYVKKINSTTIKLARSKSSIFNNSFLKISGKVTDSVLINEDYYENDLLAPNIFKSIPQTKVISLEGNYETKQNQNTGILVNGVEILNYKSKDSIYYGEIESVDILDGGKDYNVLFPPSLTLKDKKDSIRLQNDFAKINVGLAGSIFAIQIDDPGFDYIETPIVTVTGGGGSGCKATCDLLSFQHQVFFKSEDSNNVNLISNTITFSDYHKFRDNEKVIYRSFNQNKVGGLNENSVYYVKVLDGYSVTVHKTLLDSVSGINTINITSYGSGVHSFDSYETKNKIGNIFIESEGSGYKNRLIEAVSSGINTITNTISIKNHGYENGELIRYDSSEYPITGLTSASSYYVTKIDDDKFKLSLVGFGTTSPKYFFERNEYIQFGGIGAGKHYFNYPPITVSVSGKIGVSTLSGQDYTAKLTPVVLGQVYSTFISNPGNYYGSEEILNYNRQPNYEFSSGRNAQLFPVILKGSIVDVIIQNSGINYDKVPAIIIDSDTGYGAILVPEVQNGSIVNIKIINGGTDYDQNTTKIKVDTFGSGCKLKFNSKKWTVNNVEKYLQKNEIGNDDGIIEKSPTLVSGSQYYHLYAPRELRKNILGTKILDGQKIYLPDLSLVNSKEVETDYHSPIIGWAYDGSPIYGPYGYETSVGGKVKLMKSGYTSSIKDKRPDLNLYPEGFFVEDFEFTNSGDLDEHNGRFGITPEFPSGVYAYFCTISDSQVETFGVFTDFKKPKFPYIIGNSYKYSPLEYNFSNEDISVDYSRKVRYTKHYNLQSETSGYNYIYNPIIKNYITNYVSKISSNTVSQIILDTSSSGGNNYKVGDIINFDAEDIYGKVTELLGRDVLDIKHNTKLIENVSIVPISDPFGNCIGVCTSPHNLVDKQLLFFTGIGTNTFRIENNKAYEVRIKNNTLFLNSNVSDSSVTGIITYFNVYGSITYPNVIENDIFSIENEIVKVLKVDVKSSRIKVQREYNGTIGESHSSGSVLTENSRKFYVNLPEKISDTNNKINREYYFNPVESVGLGTVGVGVSLTISNPGLDESEIFVPIQSIYIKDHGLKTGDRLIYSSNGESGLDVSEDGNNNFNLTDGYNLYAVKFTNNLIGLSTSIIGLGSTGNYIGISSTNNLLYFVSNGSGVNHSIKTNYIDLLPSQIKDSVVVVSTANTHYLKVNDPILVSIDKVGVSTTIKVKYNDYNRRILVGTFEFPQEDINLNDSTITIKNHNIKNGQKVVYNSANASINLINNGIYYVNTVSENKIRLCNSYSECISYNPKYITIGSAEAGEIGLINPPITAIAGKKTILDLTDNSLSYNVGSRSYSAFEFKFYYDYELRQDYQFDTTPEIISYGNVGIDTNARVEISINLPNKLFYKVNPINLDKISQVKKDIIVDSYNISNNNTLSVENSIFSGVYNVSKVGIGSTNFEYYLGRTPEQDYYENSVGSDIKYYTTSSSEIGPISDASAFSYGLFDYIPSIKSITSNFGSGALLYAADLNIGNITDINTQNIGFDFPSDQTLKPYFKSPQLIRVEPLGKFDFIKKLSPGINYTADPDLLVYDPIKNIILDDITLQYSSQNTYVEIVKNTNSLSGYNASIIPINNTNGIPIISIIYNSFNKDVVVGLGASYSSLDDFPFRVNDRFMIENVSVGVSTSGKGYNTNNYNYKLFTVKSIDPNIGGSNSTITFNMKGFLSDNENPGTFSLALSNGFVIPEKYFPVFEVGATKGSFILGEYVSNGKNRYKIVDVDDKNDLIKVLALKDEYENNDILYGEISNTKCVVKGSLISEGFYKLDSYSSVSEGWSDLTGFLNESTQRIHDSDYYQYFSYSLKSKVEYDNWDSYVNSLNHTSGYKKFSDLQIESGSDLILSVSAISEDSAGISFSGFSDIVESVDLNCINDFDLVSEKTIKISDSYISNELIFSTKELQDYFESVGNIVLIFDDISVEFNNTPRSTPFSVVDTFRLENERFKKYITYVRDQRFIGERQFYIISMMYDNFDSYLNQYGRIDTARNLGSFDFVISGDEGNLLFYPVNFEVNDYDISYISYNMNDYINGPDSTSLGVVGIAASTKYINSGSTGPTNIIQIPTSNRSAKVLVGVESLNLQDIEFIEFSIVHDGNDIHVLDYGLMSNASSESSVGLGTYHFYYSGSNINVDFTPTVALAHTSNFYSITVAIGDTSSSGVSTVTLNNTSFSSHYTGIGSTSSPIENNIASYSNPYSGAYYLISIEDTTNNRYEFLETVVINDKTKAYLVDFAPVRSSIGLGTIGAYVSGSTVDLKFTPLENIDVEVRVFQNALSLVDAGTLQYEINLNNASIDTGYGLYEGTSKDIRKSFNLKYQNEPVFEKTFAGNNSKVINIENNTINIPNHFYVTGEEVTYSYLDDGVHSPIGIVTTSIVGIGTTDILPENLYVIKVNSNTIKLAESAQNALLTTPIEIQLSNIGIGSFHKFTAKNQNSRCLIAIDNFIQSPIVGTSITTLLASDIETSDSILNFAGITSFFSGELIRIDNEIMRINKTGIADSNLVLVQRPWMGTNLGFHTSGSLIRKIEGDYNIVGNTINFIEAPAGKSPIGTITNRPSDRDYTGITTFSTFDGRTFLKSSIPNTSSEPYSKNYIFDSLSNQFNGITTTYTLTSSSNNVSGFSTGNAIMLIDGVFQQPRRLGNVNIEGAYYLNEVSGITTVTFVGTASSTVYDINQSKLPYGGVIVSFGSTGGLGYQPLISAGATATISVGGTITSISVGNTGSGYRATKSVEIITEVLESVSIGGTEISILNANGVLNKLTYHNNNYISIGSKLNNAQIVGFGTTSITISTASTSPSSISSGDIVKIKLTDPKMGIVNVGYATENSESYSTTFVGFTTVIAGNISPNVTIINPGIGFTEPPNLVFDAPSSYTNLKLQYSSISSGIGTEAEVSVVVGQGSSITDITVKNYGYGYKPGDILTVPTNGLYGIPLDPTVSPSFIESRITVANVFNNKFSSWTVGDLLPIDPLDDLFDGIRKLFPIRIDGQLRTIRAKTGSPIDIKATLLVFVNNILQVPGESYIFEGGSIIAFTEAPKNGDTCSILFYRGTADVDVSEVDILETIQIGDDVQINSDDITLTQNFRTITQINATDNASTNPYSGVGISTNEILTRPIKWKKQTEDRIVNGKIAPKSRVLYEPMIYPVTNIIQTVGIASTEIFVDNLKTFFDSYKENALSSYISDIEIISQDEILRSTAEAVVSSAGTITSITVTNPGLGYTFIPTVSIQRTVGVSTNNVAIATAHISSGQISSIEIIYSGIGYSETNPPSILIESPKSKIEKLEDVTYKGDFGSIVGISTISTIDIPVGIEFDFYIPKDSYVRNLLVNNSGISTSGISGIQTNYYFTIRNSNVGTGLTSLRTDYSIIGIGSEYLDNIYQAARVSIAQTDVTGIGVTNIVKVAVNVSDYSSISTSFGVGYYGDFSWGKIELIGRKNPQNFDCYDSNGILGIETSPLIRRSKPLKYNGYL